MPALALSRTCVCSNCAAARQHLADAGWLMLQLAVDLLEQPLGVFEGDSARVCVLRLRLIHIGTHYAAARRMCPQAFARRS
jgi:hypothetical protein